MMQKEGKIATRCKENRSAGKRGQKYCRDSAQCLVEEIEPRMSMLPLVRNEYILLIHLVV